MIDDLAATIAPPSISTMPVFLFRLQTMSCRSRWDETSKTTAPTQRLVRLTPDHIRSAGLPANYGFWANFHRYAYVRLAFASVQALIRG